MSDSLESTKNLLWVYDEFWDRSPPKPTEAEILKERSDTAVYELARHITGLGGNTLMCRDKCTR